MSRLGISLCLLAAAVSVPLGIASWSMWPSAQLEPVLTYGTADDEDLYFQPKIAAEGGVIEVCFRNVVWHRLCPTTFYQYLQPTVGERKDVQYNVSVPPEPGPVPLKCRKFDVPVWSDAGPEVRHVRVTSFARSFCGEKREEEVLAKAPTAYFFVRKVAGTGSSPPISLGAK